MHICYEVEADIFKKIKAKRFESRLNFGSAGKKLNI